MRVLVLFSCIVLVFGCATKRYGRLQPVSATEAQLYDCRDIEIELAKVNAFREQIAEADNINMASVAGFLGDFGIGNTMEHSEALDTATVRESQLRELQAEKGCAMVSDGDAELEP